jgi:hypothetical protein
MSAIVKIGLTLYGQRVQNISIPIGSDVLWTLNLEDPITRLPIDLTGATNVTMSLNALDLRNRPLQPPLIARQAIPQLPLTNGVCTVQWVDGDTLLPKPFSQGLYGLDVWFTDTASNRLAMMPHSTIELSPIDTLPTNPVTPLPSEPPLGQGPPGPAGPGEAVFTTEFTYLTASPLILGAVDAGDILYRASILIETAFNGVVPTISFGTFGSPGLALSTAEVKPAILGQYETTFLIPLVVADFLILTINSNGSTQGRGLLLYNLKEE